MKKLSLILTISALAFVPALQAGEEKASEKAPAAPCSESAKQAPCSESAKQAACSEKAVAAKPACCTAKKVVRVLHSPRGAMMAKR